MRLGCYNSGEVIAVPVKSYHEVLRDIQTLDLPEKRKLMFALMRELAVPLYDPKEFYDDWEDEEVDRAYAEPG